MARTVKSKKESLVTLSTDITKLFEVQMRLEMLKNGMRTSYRHLLRSLADKDGVTQLDLVKVTKLKAPTVSTTLRNMETDGLVRRETDKDDARATRVYITDKGREIDRKMRLSNAKIEKVFLSGLTNDEKENIFNILGKMKSNMEKISGISADDEIVFDD